MRIDVDSKNFLIFFDYDHALVKEVRGLPGRRWNPDFKVWMVPRKHASAVYDFGVNFGFEFSESAAKALEEEEKKAPQLFDIKLRNLAVPWGSMTLMQHQRVAVEHMVARRRLILADDMGLGKTLSALVAAEHFDLPIHVICPASLIENWRREADKCGVRINSIYSWAKLPEEIAGDYVLIVDEAHYAQGGHHTKRGGAFLNLSESASAVFLLTGTPLKNGKPINLMPLLQAIDHGIVANVRNYQKYYCDAKPTRFSRWDTSGARHLDELHERTKTAILRRTKAECLDLPDKQRVFREVEETDGSIEAYTKTYDELRIAYRERVASGEITTNVDGLVLLDALRQASSHAKIEGAVELAEEIIAEGRNPVLFTAYVETAKAIAAKLNVLPMTGETPLVARQALIDRFQGGSLRAMVCTFGVGGLGITLTQASEVILVDRPWTPADTVQAEDRLHRIGQKNAVTSYWLQWKLGGIDESVDKILDSKQERIELVLHGRRKTLRGGSNIGDVAKELVEVILAE